MQFIANLFARVFLEWAIQLKVHFQFPKFSGYIV